MMGFTLLCTCMHCGGQLQCEAPPKVSDLEATAHVVCLDCRAEMTVRVLFTNRRAPAALPAVTMGASFAGAL